MLESIQLKNSINHGNEKGLTKALEESLKSGKSSKPIPQLLEHAKKNKINEVATKTLTNSA